MKSKLALIGLVMVSAVALAGCSTKKTTNNNSENGQQNQEQVDQNGTPGQGRPEMKEIDYVAAAETLGVTEDALKEAMGITEETITVASGTPGQPKRMDLATAAKNLGVEETALREALGMTDMGNGPQGQPPVSGTPDQSNKEN